MTAAIRQLCALAVFCGVLMSVMPEGGVKRMAAIGCTAALLLSLSSAVRQVRAEDFKLDLARYHERSEELRERSGEARDRLDRSVIEAEYAAYICDEASRLGAPTLRAEVTARWDLAGLWLPYEVRLSGVEDKETWHRLIERIEAELGVPEERIVWDDEG